MRVHLTCYSIETGVRHESAKVGAGEPYTVALFLDTDPVDKLGAFLKYSGEDASSLKRGQVYEISLTGLSPAKGDKSSYYIRGKVIHEPTKNK